MCLAKGPASWGIVGNFSARRNHARIYPTTKQKENSAWGGVEEWMCEQVRSAPRGWDGDTLMKSEIRPPAAGRRGALPSW